MSASIAAKGLVSSPMKWAVGGWTCFIAENFILSENRTALIDLVGEDGYHACYGTLSTAAMGTVAYGYLRRVRDAPPLLWRGPAPPVAKALSFACLSVGLGLASQIPPSAQIPVHFVRGDHHNSESSGPAAAVPAAAGPAADATTGWKVRCPFDFTDKKDDASPVHGLERITRHPGLWSFGLLGLGSAFLVPSLPQRAWLAMPAMVPLVGGAHTDSRYRRGMGGTLSEEYDGATSNIPFVALLSGAQGSVREAAQQCWEEVKPLNALIAVGVSAIWVGTRGRVIRVPRR